MSIPLLKLKWFRPQVCDAFMLHTDPQKFLNILESEYLAHLSVLELMAVFLNVLEDIISVSLRISPNFWPHKLLMFFVIFSTRELFSINLR